MYLTHELLHTNKTNQLIYSLKRNLITHNNLKNSTQSNHRRNSTVLFKSSNLYKDMKLCAKYLTSKSHRINKYE